MNTIEQQSNQPFRRRRRWPRVLLGLFLLLIIVALLGPIIAAPIVRGKVVAAVNDKVSGRASLEKLGLGLGGSVRAGGFELVDERGARFASLRSLDVDVGLAPLLRRRIDVDVTMVGLEVFVRRDADGTWNFEGLMKPEAERAPSEPEGEAAELPSVRARVALTEGRVVIESAEGQTTLEHLRFRLDLDDLATRAPFALNADVHGPGGPGGKIELAGELTLAHAGRIGADTIEGLIEASLDAIALVELQPLFGLARAGTVVAGGRLQFNSSTTIARGPAVTSDSALTLDGLQLLEGERTFALDTLRFDANAKLDAAGSGTHLLTFELPGLAELRVTGESSALYGDAGKLTGVLEARGELAGLAQLARGFMPLLPGREFEGVLSADADWSFAMGAQGGGSLRLSSGLEGVALRDADGRELDLDGLEDARLELVAAIDRAAARFELQRFELAAGPVQASAHAGVSGIGTEGSTAAPVLTDSELRLEADLDRLERIAREFVDMGERGFGGRLSVRADARDEAGRWIVGGRAELVELRLAGMGGGPDAPLSMNMNLTSEIVPAPGGFDAGFEGGDAVLEFSARMDRVAEGAGAGEGAGAVEGALERFDQRLALAGLRFDRAAGQLDVPLLELGGDLLQGGGAFKIVGLGAQDARPEFEGRVELGGSYAAMSRLANAFAPDSAVELAGEWRLECEARADAGTTDVTQLEFTSPGVSLRARGSLSGYSGEDAQPAASWTIEPEIVPLAFTRWAQPWLAGAELDGEPLAGAIDVRLEDGVLTAAGAMASAHLEASLSAETPEGEREPIVLRELALRFDMEHDAAREGGRLELRLVEFGANSLEASVKGTLTGTGEPATALAAFELAVDADLAELLPDHRASPSATVREAAGQLALRSQLSGVPDALELHGRLSITDLHLVLPSATEPGVEGRIDEARFVSDFNAALDLDAGALDLTRVTLESETIRGEFGGRFVRARGPSADGAPPVDGAPAAARFEQLAGDFTYVPDRLDRWLRPWLPGRLAGTEPQPLRFTLAGALEPDKLALLRALDGEGTLGLGTYTQSGVELSGALTFSTAGEALTLGGNFDANGGKLELNSRVDLRAAETPERPLDTSLRIEATGMELRPELAPLLAHVHPALIALKSAGTGSVRAALTSGFELRYGSPLTANLLAVGWDAVQKRAIGGGGRLELTGVSLGGSPLLSSITSLLGEQAVEGIALSPVSFTIREGQLGYEKPWQWTIADAATQFGGTIGLDGVLAMNWSVPVTTQLVSRHSFLKLFEGETVNVPIGGTIESPQVSLQATLDGLAKNALRGEIEKRAGDLLPDLRDILGGRNNSGGGSGGAAEGPEALLKRADELHGQDKQPEAAALYKEIRDKHKLSLTYLLNKSRIDSRSKQG